MLVNNILISELEKARQEYLSDPNDNLEQVLIKIDTMEKIINDNDYQLDRCLPDCYIEIFINNIWDIWSAIFDYELELDPYGHKALKDMQRYLKGFE